jgi:hypothetical protein
MAKKSKGLLPKRIGKLKVRKSVRRGALGDLLASKAGQALIAEAVLALGALAGAKLGKSPKVRGAVANVRAKGAKAGRDATAAKATFTYALGEAARTFSDALHRSPADRAPAADGPAWAPAAPAPRARPARARTRRRISEPTPPPA